MEELERHAFGGPLLSGPRRRHTLKVLGRAREFWPHDPLLQRASLLHDVGYAEHLVLTGMHAVDGGRWCAEAGEHWEVSSLVAWHTGAWYEADERGLLAELEAFERPSEERLDALTLCDLTTSPTGKEVGVPGRIAEILRRYPDEHPVHRAVTRSQGELVLACRRAIKRLGLSEGWGLTAL